MRSERRTAHRWMLARPRPLNVDAIADDLLIAIRDFPGLHDWLIRPKNAEPAGRFWAAYNVLYRELHPDSFDECDHECGAEATVMHADGRCLCRTCYCIETGNEADLLRPCPTCNPSPLVRSRPDSGKETAE